MGVSRQRYTTDLTDSQWRLIKDWLLPPPALTGRPRLSLREVLNAIYYADRGYRTERGHLARCVARQCIALTAVRPPVGQRGFTLLPQRRIIESTFRWLPVAAAE